MSGTHFDEMAAEYARSRPPYPDVVFETLEQAGVIGPGRRVLEIGAGAGLATVPIIERGSEVVALEPGRRLAEILAEVAPRADVVVAGLEDATLPDDRFDSAVAATAMHWVDLPVGLPKLHHDVANQRSGGESVGDRCRRQRQARPAVRLLLEQYG